jgi:integrase
MFTLMRGDEAGRLRWEDVNMANRRFMVSNTKNSDDLFLPLTSTTYLMLERRLAERDESLPSGEFVFGSMRFSRPDKYHPEGGDATGYIDELRKYVRKATGDPHVNPTFHQVGRAFGSDTMSQALHIPDSVVNAIGNWKATGVRERHYFNRGNVEAKRDPMQKYDDWLQRGIAGEDQVVPFAVASAG